MARRTMLLRALAALAAALLSGCGAAEPAARPEPTARPTRPPAALAVAGQAAAERARPTKAAAAVASSVAPGAAPSATAAPSPSPVPVVAAVVVAGPRPSPPPAPARPAALRFRATDPEDHFVAVRAEPRTSSAEVARLLPGDEVICADLVRGQALIYLGRSSDAWARCPSVGGYIFLALLEPIP